MSQPPIRILFVCYGNICRSPTAECVLRKLLAEQLPGIEVELDSAGTSDQHTGKGADVRTRAAASGRGYSIDSLARGYLPLDADRFDLILAMDRENLEHLWRVSGRQEKVRLFSSFLNDAWPIDVPDPYYGGEAGFEYVLDMIEAAANPLLNWIRDEHESRRSTAAG